MSEILTLAQKFKAQSQQQAKTIEQEVQNATTQLNSFMTAKLQESETIISQGMTSLDASNEQLQQMLDKHQQDLATALTTYLNNVQAHLTQDLNQLAKENQTMIQNYAQHTTQLIEQRESAIAQAIKSKIGKWATIAGIALLVIFVLGVLLGTKMNKPTTYKYYHDSKSGQTYMLPLKD
ncbi:MbeB family mobilization protein [Psychrobacter sp. Marseille-P5312]|uniref:MbeB family mobilization protein n=1 Tax=Psychrobacter sp. Marseille-P5312 TaxID=2086574 RepID=UPI000CF70EA0